MGVSDSGYRITDRELGRLDMINTIGQLAMKRIYVVYTLVVEAPTGGRWRLRTRAPVRESDHVQTPANILWSYGPGPRAAHRGSYFIESGVNRHGVAPRHGVRGEFWALPYLTGAGTGDAAVLGRPHGRRRP